MNLTKDVVLGRLRDLLAQQLEVTVDQVDPCCPLDELPNVDSLKLIKAVVLLETQLGVSLDESLIFESGHLDDLAAAFLAEVNR